MHCFQSVSVRRIYKSTCVTGVLIIWNTSFSEPVIRIVELGQYKPSGQISKQGSELVPSHKFVQLSTVPIQEY
jgi:hypothetical protein